MSLETLVLFALFVLLPLIERLIRSARRRQQETPVPSGTRPVPKSPSATRMPRPSGGTPPPSALPPSALPPYERDIAVTEVAPLHWLTQVSRRKVPLAPDTPRGRQRLDRVFRWPTDLRRAVVLMTVLEPCRALEDRELGPRINRGTALGRGGPAVHSRV